MDQWKSQFSQGFSSTLAPTDLWPLWLFLALLLVSGVVVVIFLVWQSWRRRQSRAITGGAEGEIRAGFVAAAGKINPYQATIIQTIIEEFQAAEPAAKILPSAILEKYSEYFYQQLKRLDTSPKQVAEFVNFHFPLQKGHLIELDLPVDGVLHLLQCHLLAIDKQKLVVELPEAFNMVVKTGMKVQVNYHYGKHFLQGRSEILSFRIGSDLVLRRPNQMDITGERRYPRATIDQSFGILAASGQEDVYPVQVLDLAPEGVRIAIARPLNRRQVYQLNFSANDGTTDQAFGPLDCIPSQTYLKSAQDFEIGLAFVYVSLENRAKLASFLRTLHSHRSGRKT